MLTDSDLLEEAETERLSEPDKLLDPRLDSLLETDRLTELDSDKDVDFDDESLLELRSGFVERDSEAE